MNAQIASMVASAALSGKFPKGKGKLVQMTGTGSKKTRCFCFTGLIAHLAAAAGVARRVKKGGKYGYVDKYGNFGDSNLPKGILEFAGITPGSGGGIPVRGGVVVGGRTYANVTLEQLNDKGAAGTGWSFKKLAGLLTTRAADIGVATPPPYRSTSRW